MTSLSNNEPKLARVKRISLYLLLVTMFFQFTKAGQLEKRHSFVFGFQVTITLDLPEKKRRLMSTL